MQYMSSLSSSHFCAIQDSSAIHVVPRLRVVRYGSTDTQQHAFLLKVTNPTLGLVRLQISVSMSYGGEPYWEDETNTNPLMDHLLAETVSNKHVNVLLLRPASPSDSVKSEMVDVESAEDTLVDIGKVREIPEPVLQWDAEKAIAAEPPSLDALQDNQAVISSVKLLANNAGSAWFQLICGTKLSDNKKQNLFRAIPLSLQIEVGNGSWESSLIQAKTESAEKDLVSFDVVLTWPVEDTTSN